MLRLASMTTLLLALTPPLAAFAAPAIGPTFTATVLSANFDADVVGQSPNTALPGAPAGDFLTLNQTAGSVVVESQVDGLTKPAHLKQNNSPGGVGLFAWAAPTAGAEQVTVSWRSVAQDDNPVTLVGCILRSTGGALLASVEYNEHGMLTYNALGGAGATLPVEYANNRANRFTIVLDFLTGKSSLSVDDVVIPGFQDVAFAQAGSDFAQVGFEGIGVHPQSFSVDGISAIATFRLPDRPPSVSAPATASGSEGAEFSLAVTASDPDGDAIASLSATPIPPGATFTPSLDNASGTLAWTPSFGQAGTYSVDFTASNALSGSATTEITISHTDRGPLISAPIGLAGEEGGVMAFGVSVSDPDGDSIGSLTANWSALPAGNDAGFTVSSDQTTGTFLWHMQVGDAGSYPVTFTASNLLTSHFTTTLSVGLAGVGVSGVFTWTPKPGDEGIWYVTWLASDAGGTSSAQTEITVMSGLSTPAPAPHLAPRLPGGVAPLAGQTPQAPQNPQKGPIISSPTKTQSNTGDTMTLSSYATSSETTLSAAAPAASLTAGSEPRKVSAVMSRAGAATSISLSADLTGLPEENDALFVVDVEPQINAPATVLANAGVPMTFQVGVVDPNADAIAELSVNLNALPGDHNATFTTNGANTIGTFTWTPTTLDAGTYTISYTALNRLVGTATTVITVAAPASARIFVGGNQKLQLGSNKPLYTVYIEPVSSSFALTDVDPATIKMISPGTGSVSEIPAATGKTIVIGDKDSNLIQDMAVNFAKGDLRTLFDGLNGKTTLTVAIEGRLLLGGFIRGTLTIEVVPTNKGPLAASISPNPLNPSAQLTFTLPREGFVRVNVFDIHGRLVKTVLDEPNAAAGDHAVTIDGRSGAGGRLASGMYFFRIESAGGVQTGRLAIVQ